MSLDLLSISQQNALSLPSGEVSNDLWRDIGAEVEQSYGLQAEKCPNGAPYICYFAGELNTPHIVQGCCNSWECPRCGQMRARAEYGRIVAGARVLAKQGETLYFLTLTCRGKELTLAEAEAGYLLWTNRLMTNIRQEAKRQALALVYAGVTERQRRGHPHSHLILNLRPSDALEMVKTIKKDDGTTVKRRVLVSKWLMKRVKKAGLGEQFDLTEIRSPVAVAVYLSKYFFKDALHTVWPPSWRRVRYSHTFPKLPERERLPGFPLVRLADWQRLQALDRLVYADSHVAYEAALARLITCVVYEPELRRVDKALRKHYDASHRNAKSQGMTSWQ